MRALVRGVAASFAAALTLEPLAAPIVLDLARAQHEAYVRLLAGLVQSVTELPADDKHPDCCFIEDTAVVVGGTAIVARIGAAARQGEEAPVVAALAAMGCAVRHLAAPATLDGGDVLQLPGSRHLLVGLSRRTNAAAVEQLAAHLPAHSVHGVPVPHGLHLKSAVTALDGATLLFADNTAGLQLSAALAEHPALAGGTGGARHVFVPDPFAANVLLLGEHVVMQAGCSASEALLEGLCTARGLRLHKLPRATELVKADAALTCCSILLPDDAQ